MDIKTSYPETLHAYGLPQRLVGKRPFNLRKRLKSYQTASQSMIIDAKKQINMFEEAMDGDSGWLMFACTSTILEYPKHVAANIMSSYYARGLHGVWLSSFDKIDRTPFSQMQIVIIDALFADSAPFRRDKIYEIINHNCNVRNLSVCVIGQYENPIEMSTHLGIKPDFGLLLK